MSGLSDQGFESKRISEIEASLKSRARSAFGEGVRLGPDSVLGRLIGIVAGSLGESWEALAGVYTSFDRRTATGVHLDNLADAIGLTRNEATPSRATVQLSGTAGTTVPAGSQIAQADTGDVYETDEAVTLDSSGDGTVSVTATETGALAAPVGTLTDIQTLVAGWDSATNAQPADTGTDRETDTELRRRMGEDTQALGHCHPLAIRAKLRNLDGVEDANIIENQTGATDGEGRPAWAYEVLVDGGDRAEIAEVIWQNKPTGRGYVHANSIAAAGNDATETVTDIDGREHTVRYSFPVYVPLYVDIDVTPNLTLSSDEAQDLQGQIASYASTQQFIGDDVIQYRYLCEIGDILEELGYSPTDLVVRIDTSDPPTNTTNIAISDIQRAVLAPSDITVS